MTLKDCQKCYQGFEITCGKCGGKKVYIENSMGWSELSGGWGDVRLICLECENETVIAEND